MTQDSQPQVSTRARQYRLVGLLLVPVLALLLVTYFMLIRQDYEVLAKDLRPDEANAIVAELKKQDVAYELAQQGSTILVPASRADELRVAIVGGGIVDSGSVGFELFNEADMGLTDFAQKINYQRALQGEIARTIMGMDGIAHARVHLALPERSLFRTNRSEPRAAVTVIPKPSIALDGARIAGIQRLVASAVTDLRVEDVAVLNQRGQLMTPDPDLAVPDRMAGASALEKAYAERVGRAISTFAPDVSFDIKVTTVQRPATAGDFEAATPGERDHAIRVVVFTPSSIQPEQQADLARIIAQVIGANHEIGDDIQFSLMTPPATAPPVVQVPVSNELREVSEDSSSGSLPSRLIEGAALAAALIGAALLLWLARRRRLARREQLYVRIRDQLRLEQLSA